MPLALWGWNVWPWGTKRWVPGAPELATVTRVLSDPPSHKLKWAAGIHHKTEEGGVSMVGAGKHKLASEQVAWRLCHPLLREQHPSPGVDP